jgi:hypothetical protein
MTTLLAKLETLVRHSATELWVADADDSEITVEDPQDPPNLFILVECRGRQDGKGAVLDAQLITAMHTSMLALLEVVNAAIEVMPGAGCMHHTMERHEGTCPRCRLRAALTPFTMEIPA